MAETDVLVVGAGPSGLTLALELSIQQIPFRIITKDAHRTTQSRALVIHSRTQELLNRHGRMASELLDRGVQGRGLAMHVGGRHIADVNVDDLGFDDTEFPKPMWISQAETEELLERKLESYGAAVERSCSLEAVTQDERGAEATLIMPDGTKKLLRCKYVVGCDGARSTVRHHTKLSLAGNTYPQHFVLCDARLKGGYSPDRISLFLGRRLMVFFPMQDNIVRIVGERAADDQNEADPDLAEIQAFVDESFPGRDHELTDPIWLAHFRFHCRGVSGYREGRLFVAGDAAHIHSPAGGQGMNTGIQDAINLGWKLARVLRGEEQESFLDSYHEERHPIGEHLLRGTDRLFQYASSQGFFIRLFRNTILPWIIPWVVGSRALRAKIFRFVSELGIKYRRSPIVGTAGGFVGPVRGGWRAPDGELVGQGSHLFLLSLCSPRNYTLLLFAGLGAAADREHQGLELATQKFKTSRRYGGLEPVRIYGPSAANPDDGGYRDTGGSLHKRYGLVKEGGVVIVRPDLHVEYIGPLASLDELLSKSV